VFWQQHKDSGQKSSGRTLRSMLQSRVLSLFSVVPAAKGHPGQQIVLAEALQYGVSSTDRLNSS
jgi:hypothetical protein